MRMLLPLLLVMPLVGCAKNRYSLHMAGSEGQSAVLVDTWTGDLWAPTAQLDENGYPIWKQVTVIRSSTTRPAK